MKSTVLIRTWCAYSISQFGSQITILTLPILAATFLHVDSLQLGYLMVAETVPSLVFGLFAGVWVDRLPKKLILIACDILRGTILLAIPISHWQDTLSMRILYINGFIIGFLTLFYDIAFWSYLPSIVQTEHLVSANGKMALSRSAADTTGPAIAGAAIQIINAPVIILINSCSYILSGLVLLFLPEILSNTRLHRSTKGLFGSIKEGLVSAWRDPIIRSLIGRAIAWNFLFSIGNTIFILFLVRQLSLRPVDVGIVFSGTGIGYLVGATLNAHLSRQFGIGLTMLISVFMCAASGSLIVPVTNLTGIWQLKCLAFIMMIFGFFAAGYNINQLTIRQIRVPKEMLSRVNATFRFLTLGIIPIGAMAGGALGQITSPRFAIFSASIIGLALSIIPLINSPLKYYRLDDSAQ